MGEGGIEGVDVEVSVLSLEDGDFSVVIIGVDFIFLREHVSGPHVDPLFYSPFEVIVL